MAVVNDDDVTVRGFAGEARQVILSAMSSNIRPKWVVVVDPGVLCEEIGERRAGTRWRSWSGAITASE